MKAYSSLASRQAQRVHGHAEQACSVARLALQSRCAAWRAWLAGQVRGLGEQVRSMARVACRAGAWPWRAGAQRVHPCTAGRQRAQHLTAGAAFCGRRMMCDSSRACNAFRVLPQQQIRQAAFKCETSFFARHLHC